MKKSDIVSIIKDKLILEKKIKKRSITNEIISLILDTFFEVIKENVLNGEHIELRGFGTFDTKVRMPKKARNPRTNEEVLVERHSIPTFKPGTDFKKIIKNSTNNNN